MSSNIETNSPPGFGLRQIISGQPGITGIAWSPKGPWLASSSKDKTIKLWDTDTGELHRTLTGHNAPVNCVAWSPTGERLASGAANGNVWLWNAESGQLGRTLQAGSGEVTSVAWSPDGRMLAASSRDAVIYLWDAESGKLLQEFHEDPGDKSRHGFKSAAWSPDGKILAAGCADGSVYFWDVDSQSEWRTRDTVAVSSIAFSPSSEIVASASQDGFIRILLTESGEQRYFLRLDFPPVSPESITSISFSFDGRLLASISWLGTIRLWRSDTWEMVSSLESPQIRKMSYAYLLAFHPTAPILATLGENDSVIHIWDLDFDRLLKTPSKKREPKKRPEQKRSPKSPKTPEPLPTIEPEPQEERFFAATSGDQPTDKDSIGFGPYVNAIADFLSNDNTRAPLTLSIEGEWGSGKSSFMLQLEKELLDRVVPRKRRMLWRVRREMRIRRERIPTPLRRLKLFQKLLVPKEVRNVTCPTVRFNAWRHDKEDALWASFAITFIRKLSKGLSAPQRLVAYFKLLFRRFCWSDGLPVLLRALTIGSVFVLTTFALFFLLYSRGIESLIGAGGDEIKPGSVFVPLIKGSGVVGYIAVFLFLVTKFKDFIGNPLSINLRQYVEAPDYKSHVAFIENFHEDFKRIVDTYARENKVFVFIDDLDRCEVPKAADLMQALNLLISDSPQLIFIIGMDREKVAAGLAVKYERLLPYLAPPPPATDGSGKQTASATPTFDTSGGLEYGYSYIEKFIQLPFKIPQPDKVELERLLDNISPRAKTVSKHDSPVQIAMRVEPSQNVIPKGASIQGGNGSPASTSPGQMPSVPDGAAPIEGGGQETPRPTITPPPGGNAIIREAVDGDSPAVREIALMVAAAFDNNPRRVKQFINSFRLKAYIVGDLRLLVPYGRPPAGERMTLQQLGKFVAISLRWPRLLADLDCDRRLLVKLQGLAGRSPEAKAAPSSPRPDLTALPFILHGFDGIQMTPDEKRDAIVEHWSKRQRLMALLQRDSDDPEKSELCSLKTLEVDNLLKISPQRSTPTLPLGKAETMP